MPLIDKFSSRSAASALLLPESPDPVKEVMEARGITASTQLLRFLETSDESMNDPPWELSVDNWQAHHGIGTGHGKVGRARLLWVCVSAGGDGESLPAGAREACV